MTLFSMSPLTVSAKVPLGFGNIPPEVFCQKSVLKNFAKIYRKTPVRMSLPEPQPASLPSILFYQILSVKIFYSSLIWLYLHCTKCYFPLGSIIVNVSVQRFLRILLHLLMQSLMGKLLFYVKNVRIRSYSGPHFFAFGLNTERYGVFRQWLGRTIKSSP